MKDFIVIQEDNVSKFMTKVNQALNDGYFVINADSTESAKTFKGAYFIYHAYLAKN